MDWKQLASQLEDKGRHGDTHLVHVNSRELKKLRKEGSGSKNPWTGLFEFFDDAGGGAAQGAGDVGKGDSQAIESVDAPSHDSMGLGIQDRSNTNISTETGDNNLGHDLLGRALSTGLSTLGSSALGAIFGGPAGAIFGAGNAISGLLGGPSTKDLANVMMEHGLNQSQVDSQQHAEGFSGNVENVQNPLDYTQLNPGTAPASPATPPIAPSAPASQAPTPSAPTSSPIQVAATKPTTPDLSYLSSDQLLQLVRSGILRLA
jgi:hypothetical protein